MEYNKTGLILEGGAMRGMFTAGVMDVFMENGITFDGTIGVSAGAVFGCNMKSHQIGRVIRYNTRFCNDPRYCSIRSWLTSGDLYNADFCYIQVPEKLDPFDAKAFNESPMEFYVVCTDVQTGRAVYKKIMRSHRDTLSWIRASASMPLASRIVEVDGFKLLDGGIADSIPLRYFERLGYQKNVVVLTQPEGYIKEPNKFLPLIRIAFKKYPNVIKALERRHEVYNETVRYIRMREKQGDVFVICPDAPLNIGARERDPRRLQEVYQLGRTAAQKRLGQLPEEFFHKER